MSKSTGDRPQYYRLIGKLVVPCRGAAEWAEWFATASAQRTRIVRQDRIGPLLVSTVFIGTDYNFSADGPPLVFETMILDDGEGLYQTRCERWDQAELMHEVALAEAKDRFERAVKALEKGGTQ